MLCFFNQRNCCCQNEFNQRNCCCQNDFNRRCFVCPPGPQGPRGFTGPVGPVGPQGPAGPPGSFSTAFGGQYASDLGLLTLSPNDTYNVTFLNQMPNNNVIYNTDSIEINETGIYLVSYFFSGSGSGSLFGINTSVTLNGSDIESLYRNIALIEDNTSLNISALVSLTAGDIVATYIKSITGGVISFEGIQNVGLSVLKVSN